MSSTFRFALPTCALLAFTASTAFAQTCTDPIPYCTSSVNSTGSGAAISWTGTASPVHDNFYLVTTGGPANQPLLYYYGAAQIATPFGNGVRCVGAGGLGTFRFQVTALDGSGAASQKVDFSQAPAGGGGLGSWSPGDTWYCQGWYRDPADGGAGFNLTDGLEVNVCAGDDPYGGSVLVPGGSFEMGRHVGSGASSELPVHPVTLDAFYMDVLEVSNQKYADFLNKAYTEGRIMVSSGVVYQVGGAGKALCDTRGASGYSQIIWTGSMFGMLAFHRDLPMMHVSWYGACAYANGRSRDVGLTPAYDETTWACDFSADGFRLPTEAEWEYAARGGAHSPYYSYPWGDTIDGSKANYVNSNDGYEGVWPEQAETTPVGYYDGSQVPPGVDMANGYGLYDMAGNVAEWCHDWQSGNYYSSSPVNNPTGPAGPGFFGNRVIRGGDWFSSSFLLRSANRGASNPMTTTIWLGFRLVAARP